MSCLSAARANHNATATDGGAGHGDGFAVDQDGADAPRDAARMGRIVGFDVGGQRIALTGHRLAVEKDIRAGGNHWGWVKTIVVGAYVTEQ